jgi:hypothetical protein
MAAAALHVRSADDGEALRLLLERSLVAGLDALVPASACRAQGFADADADAEPAAKRGRADDDGRRAPFEPPAARDYYRVRGALGRLLEPAFADRYIRTGTLVFVSRDADRPLHAGCARETAPAPLADLARNALALDASGLLLLRVDAATYWSLGLVGTPLGGPANSARRAGRFRQARAGRHDVTVTDGGPYVVAIDVRRRGFRPGDAEYERVQRALGSAHAEPVSLVLAWSPDARPPSAREAGDGRDGDGDGDGGSDGDGGVVFPPEFEVDAVACAVRARALVDSAPRAAQALALPDVPRIAAMLARARAPCGADAPDADTRADAAAALEGLHTWLGLAHAMAHQPLLAPAAPASPARLRHVDASPLEAISRLVAPLLPRAPRRARKAGREPQLVAEGWRLEGLLAPPTLARAFAAARVLVDTGRAPWASIAAWGVADAGLDPSRRVPVVSRASEASGAGAPGAGRAESDLLVVLLPGCANLLFSAHALGQRAAWLDADAPLRTRAASSAGRSDVRASVR